MNINLGDVIFDIFLVTLLVLLMVLFGGSPDLMDAIIYNLTDGQYKTYSP